MGFQGIAGPALAVLDHVTQGPTEAVLTPNLANAVITTAVETEGWTWTQGMASASYGLVRQPVIDQRGPVKPPGKRKVGGSTPPMAILAR